MVGRYQVSGTQYYYYYYDSESASMKGTVAVRKKFPFRSGITSVLS